MALSDDVQLRYHEQILKELTNPRSSDQTSINTTKLTQACTSVQAQFKVYAQVAYDGALAEHVDVATDGVVAILQKWGASAKGVAKIRWDDWIEQCRALRDVGPRARIKPTSTSTMTVTEEDVGAKPAFDTAKFSDVLPGAHSTEDDLD